MSQDSDRVNLIVDYVERMRSTWDEWESSERLATLQRCARFADVSIQMIGSWTKTIGLAAALQALDTNVEALSVSGVTADDMKSLSDKAKESSTLKYLRIEGGQCRPIGNDGAQHLSDLLRGNAVLLGLIVSGCEIGPVGIEALADGLRENSTLLLLDVSWNMFGPRGMEKIVEALRGNSSLLYLNIRGCSLCSVSCGLLSALLCENSSIMFLDIYHNRLKSDSFRVVCDGLKENRSLLFLDVGDNRIGPDGAQCLTELMQENETLLFVNLSDCKSDESELLRSDYSISDRSMCECRELIA